MQIRKNVPLREMNTFHVNAMAQYFAAFTHTEELLELLKVKKEAERLMILGGGSNILFTKDYDGWILKNEIAGIEILRQDDQYVWIQAGGGVNWHQLVLFSVNRGWGGLENLSLIPGCTGAAPIQNIGAYGAELKDVFYELEALHLQEKMIRKFSRSQCRFGYRDSIFKNNYKGQYAILNITLQLYKEPVLNTSYGAIRQELEKRHVHEIGVKAVSDAVINIRKSKLPDPGVLGNGGSFFKNPVIPKRQFKLLQQQYGAEIPFFVPGPDDIKIPAAWLIEQCGYKGYRKGDAGCHEKQPLVLVNYGSASGEDILDLSAEIMEAVNKRYGILLEREINVL